MEGLRNYIQKVSKEKGMFLPGIEKGIKGYNNKKKDRLFEGLQPLFSQKAAHLKKEHIEFIDELIDFPKGAHDDTIDAFWLAVQFTQGYQKPGGNFKEKKTDGKRSFTKVYNWMTGLRI